LQPENGILIKSWYKERSDEELFKLGPILKKIVRSKVKDVRKFLVNLDN